MTHVEIRPFVLTDDQKSTCISPNANTLLANGKNKRLLKSNKTGIDSSEIETVSDNLDSDVVIENHGSGLTTSITLLARLDDTSDQTAWSRFVDAYSPQIHSWCIKAGLRDIDAADATQDVLLKLVNLMRESKYHPDRGSFRGWLKTVTSNLVRDIMRMQKSRPSSTGNERSLRQLVNLQDETSFKDLALLIERGYERELLTLASTRVRNRVRDKTWKAYVGTAVEGMPAAVVAKKLNVTVSEVYVGKSRVLKMLRREIAKLDC